MRLLFLGAPGAGKGTQAKMIAEEFGLLHIAPGDIFRQEVKAGTELGHLVEGIMAEGRLVPDDITIQIIEKRLNSPEARNGFVLDGFPRNLAQAQALKDMLERKGERLDLVIDLVVPEEELLKRSMSRRVCAKCGKPYNLNLDPPEVEGRCDVCGGELIVRDDDKEDTIKERFRVYHEETEPLREYYAKCGILVSVDGCGDIDSVCDKIKMCLLDKGLIREAKDR